MMPHTDFKQGERAAWLGIIGNILLAVMKGIVGFWSGSKALIADAANSASDVASSFAVLIGLKAARIPPDEDHPYGHGKAEPIAAIIVSILLILVGVEIGISSIRSMIEGVDASPHWAAIIVLLVSIVAKEALFQYKYRLGKKHGSQALITVAWDHRSDVYASLAALIGVGGAVIGARLEIPLLYYLDPLAGLFVSLIVIKMGYHLIMEAIHNTMDHVLHEEDTKDLFATIEKVPGVIQVDDLRAREHGHYVIVDVKIGVHPKMTVAEGHRIGKQVKKSLMTHHSHVSDVFVHINPYQQGYPYNDNVDSDRNDFPNFIH